jgi:hypothetical protein
MMGPQRLLFVVSLAVVLRTSQAKVPQVTDLCTPDPCLSAVPKSCAGKCLLTAAPGDLSVSWRPSWLEAVPAWGVQKLAGIAAVNVDVRVFQSICLHDMVVLGPRARPWCKPGFIPL